MKLRLCFSNFQAEHLCNIMSEFDPRSEFLKMRVDPKEKVLSMAAKSNILQEFAVDVPSQSDIVQSFQVRMAYRFLPASAGKSRLDRDAASLVLLLVTQ